MSKCKPCLRPKFMDLIAKLLNEGSVNVIIPDMGKEATRFVADMKRYEWEKQVLIINLADCRQDYTLFLQQLSQAYYGKIVDEDLGKLSQHLSEDKRSFVLVLHRFDAMGKTDVDTQFDQNFYSHLNHLKNLSKVTLLTIAPESLDSNSGMMFRVAGEMISSPLIISQNRELPMLSHDELGYELKRRDLGLSSAQEAQVLDLAKKGGNYNFNEFDRLCCCLENDTNYSSEISEFRRALRKNCPNNQKSGWRRLYNFRTWIEKLFAVLNIKGFFQKVLEILKIIFIDGIFALGVAIIDFLKSRKK